ncbi:AMP-binding protein [Antrihabitans spumae]|uniref:AMP-binding protein n=1 Tax=Antrihabitans spumae TaxID=3373370 RepID=A0ABW7JYS5_9NOCA
MESIVDWIAFREAEGGSIAFYDDGDWSRLSYDDLAAKTRGVAESLRGKGIGRGDRVALILPTGVDFARYFFATLAIGAVPTAVAPVGLTGNLAHREYVGALLSALDATAVVGEAGALAEVERTDFIGAPMLIDVADEVRDRSTIELTPARGGETAIIQFTSGSTSAPRGVRLSAGAVLAHIAMLKSVFHQDGEHGRTAHSQTFGSWLPLHHDMGLIGTFMSPITYGQDVWLMRPEHFVRRPALWLELFGRHGLHHSAMPNFAVERIVRLVSERSLVGMDFSTWRTLIVGSDRINFRALRAFYELLAPYGFKPETIKPGYGMAETTLAITTTGPGEEPTALTLDFSSMRASDEARIVRKQSLSEFVSTSTGVGSGVEEVNHVVSCGRELPGAAVAIIATDGQVLPDGCVGEIEVSSPAIFSGYLGDGPPDQLPRYRTGDLGLRLDGELYVIGRVGNSVKINGSFVLAEDAEIAIAERLNIKHDKVIVVLRDVGSVGRAAALVVFQQRVAAEKVDQAVGVLTKLGIDAANAALAFVAPLAVPRTTSGKPKRAVLWDELESGATEMRAVFVGAQSRFAERRVADELVSR